MVDCDANEATGRNDRPVPLVDRPLAGCRTSVSWNRATVDEHNRWARFCHVRQVQVDRAVTFRSASFDRQYERVHMRWNGHTGSLVALWTMAATADPSVTPTTCNDERR
jgi:hypothetical protein